jgi:DNA mismatch repair protein MSH3
MTTLMQMAIADAVLHHLVEQAKCKTLFITHYPLVATELERKFPEEVQNLHMSYTTDIRINGTRDVTFLYQLIPGIALESCGFECCSHGGHPDKIHRFSSERSELCRTVTEQRTRRSRSVHACHSPPFSLTILQDTQTYGCHCSRAFNTRCNETGRTPNHTGTVVYN